MISNIGRMCQRTASLSSSSDCIIDGRLVRIRGKIRRYGYVSYSVFRNYPYMIHCRGLDCICYLQLTRIPWSLIISKNERGFGSAKSYEVRLKVSMYNTCSRLVRIELIVKNLQAEAFL